MHNCLPQCQWLPKAAGNLPTRPPARLPMHHPPCSGLPAALYCAGPKALPTYMIASATHAHHKLLDRGLVNAVDVAQRSDPAFVARPPWSLRRMRLWHESSPFISTPYGS